MSSDKPEKRLNLEALVIRLIWMLVFLLVWQVATPLLVLIVLAQLFFRLFRGAPNPALAGFGDSLSQYLQQMGRFFVFSTEEKPWPVADWPDPVTVPEMKPADKGDGKT